MTSGWRIGSIFGIPLLLHPAWFYSLALFTFFFSADWQRQGWDAGWAWLAGLAMTLLLFSSVVLHELGHSLVARSQGIEVNAITLFLFGGIASIDQESKTPGQAFGVAIAGPSVSFALFVLLLLFSILLPAPQSIKVMLSHLAGVNLVLALFNMIPGLPLDGGQVVKAAIWRITGSRMQGVRWAALIGLALSWTAVGVGLIGFLSPLWNAILVGLTAFLSPLRFSFLWLVLLGSFGVRRSTAYLRLIRLQQAMLQLQATDAMTRSFQTVEIDLTLEQFAARCDARCDTAETYYAASNGQYQGRVAIEALATIDRSQWPQQTVADLVQPFAQLPTVTESMPVAEVIEQLEAQQLKQVAVLSTAEMITGVIDRASVVKTLADYLHLRVPESVLQQIQTSGQFPDNLQLQKIAKDALR